MKLKSLLFIALSGITTVVNADKLRIATEGAYPPFNNIDSSGELVGFDVEIARALCKQMERDCELVAQDWDGIIPSLLNNKYDVIVASMSITDERKEKIDFTDPYYSNYLSVIASGHDVSMNNLGKKNIGAQRSTIGSQWVEDEFGSRASINLYDTLPAAFSDLKAGRIDAVIADYLPATEWLNENEGYIFIADKIDIGDSIGIGIRKGEDELRSALNKALEGILKKGVYEKISQKYFSTNIY